MDLIKRDFPREIRFTPGINPYAAGSVIAEYGKTKIYITAIIEETVPPFLIGKGKGWVTAEYAMLPGSTHSRVQRERKGISGRSQEIQRLIGRSLRSIIDTSLLGERTILIDCDVLVADGGTRTASISGGYVALALSIKKLLQEKKITKNPLREAVAAISIGLTKDGKIITDLNYEEDSSCETDMNIVMTKNGKFVEIQGTAEGQPFAWNYLEAMVKCAEKSLRTIFELQNKALE